MKARALRFLTLGLLMLGSGMAKSATLTWTNLAGGDWNDTNNWSPNQVPGSGDNVIITQSGTYTVTDSGSATLGTLTLGGTGGSQTLNIASLTMNNASTVNSNGVLNWGGGDLEGALTVAPGGTLSISNTVYFAENDTSPAYTNTAALTNYGTVIWAANITSYGNYQSQGGAAIIDNAGLWESVADNTIQFSGGGGSPVATNLFVNTGTLEKIGGTGTSTIGWNFDNEGGTLETPDGYFAFSGNWTGSGLLYGNATVLGNIGGIIGSNAVINWSGGDLEGALTVAQGGTLTISNTVYFAGNDTSPAYTNTAALTNYGTVIWAGDITSYANYQSQGGAAIIDNAGLWESVADNTIQFTGGGGSPVATNLFVNTGTLEKIGGTGTSTIGWNFDNEGGTVTTLSGAFSMGNWTGNGLIVGNATYSSGTISGTVVPGAVINISGATINGSLIVSSNAVLNWSGGDLEGALTVAQGGTLTISNTVYFAENDISPAYTNTAALTNYGTVIWAGDITSYANYQSQGGAAIIDNAGLWESVADNTIQFTGGGGSPVATNLFVNTGTLEKIGGTGTSTIGWNFDNEGGTVTTLSGAFSMGNWTGNGLIVGNATYSSGTISGTVVPGAVINISGATINGSLIVSSNAVLNWSGGDLEGALTVAQGGTLTISNTVYFAENDISPAYTNTAALTNYGTVIWAGNITSYANYQSQDGAAIIDNAGLWESVADNTIQFSGGGGSPVATNLFVNTGTLEKIGGTGTSTIGWNFDNEGGTVTTLSGSFSMGNWTGSGFIYGNATYSSGTISGTLVPGAVINISGATINSSLHVSSNAVLNWSGGDLEGSLTVAQGGTLTISNTVWFAYNNYNYGYTNTATLTNYGTVVWAGTIYAGAFNTGLGGGIIDNAGLWESVADNTMSPTYGYTSTGSSFINTGTLEKIGGNGTSTIGWNFDNDGGTVTTVTGAFSMANWSGNGLVADNATFSGGTFSGTLNPGVVANFSGVTINGPLTVSASAVMNFSGTINSSLIVSSNGVLNWSGGDLEGSLTVAQGGTLTISNTVWFAYNNYNYGYTNTATLTNYGTVVWAGTIYAGAFNTGLGGGIIDNAGLWESVADNTMSPTYGYTSTGSSFINTGTLEKTGGTGATTIGWNFNGDYGALETSAGYFTFSGNWLGSGLMQGNASISGTLGTAVASNAVINWLGGDLEGSLTVAEGGTLSISNTVTFALDNYNYGYTNTAALTNHGKVIWAGTIYGVANSSDGGGGFIDNAGLWESVADNTMSLTYGYPSTNSLFLNTGTLEKTGGTGTSTIGWNFDNENGTLTTLSGTFAMNWTGNGTVFGNATISGGTIGGIIGSNTFINWSGGDLEGALTVAQGGTLTISNTVTFALDNYNNGYTNTAALTNYGTVIWAGTIYGVANSSDGGGGLIDNAGLWESVADNTMSATYGWTSTNSLFLNTGTLEKIGGTGTSAINWNFDDESGTVLAVDGTVGFGGGLDLTNGLLDFAVSGPASFGQISVSGTANLAGGIGAVLLNGYVPVVGAQFNVMTFGANTGAFTDYSGLNAGGGIAFDPTVSASTVTLQVAATNFFGVKPFIVTGPAPQTVNYNSTAMLNVVVSGSSPLTFQWKQDAMPVPGGTNATLTLTNVLVSQAGEYTVSITNSAGGAVSQPVMLTVLPAVPVITWSSPAGITYGTPLSSNQLDASANVPGTFVYNPPAGTVLSAGGQTLFVTFTPNDAVDYTSPSAYTSISVAQVPLTVTANGGSRAYGQTNPVFGGTIVGLTNGDNITATYSCSAVPISPPTNYPIVPALVDPNGRSGNYSVTLNNGLLTVSPGPAPTLTGVTPNTGVTNGGTAVTLFGSGYELGAGVAFGSQAATSVSVNADGSQISAITPAGALGLVNVVMTNPDNTTVTLTNGFTYTGPPDLAPANVSAPGSGVSGSSIQVSCVVTNEGSGSASGYWADGIYFSSNALPNFAGAELLGYAILNHNVPAAGSYAWTNSVTLPQAPPGAYYLFVVVNDTSSGYPAINEATKANNTSATKLLQIDSPDLAVSGITAPAGALVGQPVQLTFTVTNTGGGLAAGPWLNEVLLANDTNGTGAQSLGAFTFNVVIPAGGSTNLTQTVILPSGLTGSLYFGVDVDSGNALPDPDRTNNTAFATTPTLITGPDLIMAQLSVPGTAQYGQSFNVSFTVTNAGGAAADASWYDQIYLSPQSNSLAGATVMAAVAGTSPLAAGSNYTRTQAVTVPVTAGSSPGNFYIVAVADGGNAQFEVTKTNNQLASPIALTLPPLPDLTVGQVGSPSAASAGQPISVSWTVTNSGAATANGSWQEAVYLVPASLTLPQFATNLAAYPVLATFTFTNDLPAGQTVSRTEPVTIPLTGLAGDLRAAVLIDSANSVLEQNESNNVALATNDLEVPQVLSLFVPVTSVLENTSAPQFNCLVSRNGDLSAALVVSLDSSATNNLRVPASVIIPAGVSSSPFTATVLDDGLPGPDVVAVLSASAGGYSGAASEVTVVNTDLPKLGLSLALPQITEGQSVTGTVTTTTVTSKPLVVALASSSSSALSVPVTVIIPANSNSVTFTAQAVQNSIMASTQTYTVSASAAGYASAFTGLSVLNDNAPTITLWLNRTNINETDGPLAAIAFISRQPVTDQAVLVALASSDPGAALVPAQVTIPALVGNATFYVAAVNGTNITGPRSALISAQALDVQGNPVGSPAAEELVVQDNHGPVLRVSIANQVVPKGVNPATTAVVWTTTPPTNDLVVALVSSQTSEATVPPTVTIPAGQTNTTFSIASLDDQSPFTSQIVEITASATNYASGSDIFTVTDTGLPDLIIASVTAPGSASTAEPLTIGFRLLNQGPGAMLNGVTQNVYLTTNPVVGSEVLVGAASFGGPLASGQYVDESVVVPGGSLPPPGTYWVVVTADANNNAVELNKANNSAVSSGPLVVSPQYTAIVQAGLTNVLMGAQVPLTGSATLAGGGPAAEVPVNILVTVRGLQRIIGVTTDANGNFSTFFTPLANEAGTYTVSAVFPGITSAPAQDQFTILGMSLNPGSLSLSLAAGGSVSGSAILQNLGDAPITGLSVSVSGLAANLATTPTLNSNYLAGQGALSLSFTLTASDASIQQSAFTVHITSAEGVIVDLPVTVTVNPSTPRLVISPSQLSTAMLIGGQTSVQFTVVNTGGAPTGPLVVSVPPAPWLSLASVNPLPSLAPGQSNLVTLLLTPAANFPLGAYTGELAVNGNGLGAQIPFTFNAVSDAHGSLVIQSVDELTFFAAGAPPLTNASVTLTDPTSGAVVTNGLTDSNGLFAVSNLLAGTYNLALTASQHSSFNGFAIVTAAQTNNVQAFLSLQTVSFSWTVVPTQIQDQTEITIQAIFQTDVPAPVIVPTPASLDLSPLTQPGQYLDVPLTFANMGLIGVSNVTISFNSSDLYQFNLLTTNLGSLPAHGTVTVPLRVTLLAMGVTNNALVTKSALKHAALARGTATPLDIAGGSCGPNVGVAFSYPCGPYGVNDSIQLPVLNAQTDCETPQIPIAYISVSISGGTSGGSGGPNGGGNGPGGGGELGGRVGGSDGGSSGGTWINFPSIEIPSTCDQCLDKQLDAAKDCLLGLVAFPSKGLTCLKNAYLCGKGLNECFKGPSVSCGLSAAGCLTDSADCDGIIAKSLLEKVPFIGEAIALISCTHDMLTACDETQGAAVSPQSSLASHLSQSETGAQAFLNLMAAQANDLQTVINPDLYFFGSSVWFSVADTNALQTLFDQFDNDIETNSDGGQYISSNERTALLALPLPSPLAASDVNAFLDRWNLTMSNYAAGILTVGQVLSGGSTNFIDFQQWTQLNTNALQVLQTYQNEGYTDPAAAWFATRSALFDEVQGGPVGTCAQVTLQIDQTAILTENAFHATLQLNNNGSSVLTNVAVTLVIKNQAGQDVSSLFGIQSPVLSGSLTAVDGTGVLAVNASGIAQWTLIPSLDAAPQVPTNYLVSGTISYIENGVAVSIPLSAQSITVQPSPQLYLTYFLQRDVYGDDPFTPQIEPSIPFPLAVMVQNKGYGPALNFQITSAQPQIVDNAKGLLINFNIIGTEVAGQPVSPSLTVNFGEIAAGSIKIGEWLFTSSLEGLFTDYSATYQDNDVMGNPRLSPIQGVEIHEITHMVQADGAWDDGQPDFLVIDPLSTESLPNTVYLSDGTIQPVSVVQTATSTGPVSGGDLQIQLTADFPAGFSYVLVPDPGNGQFPLQNVIYANGTNFLTNNFWLTDRTFIGLSQPPLLQNNLHLFVYHTNAGPDTFTLVYTAPSTMVSTNAPVSSVYVLPAQSPPTFGVVWSGASDLGAAALAYFDIYASDNGGPFVVWQSQTTNTGAIFNGVSGHTYSFYSVATDVAGHREATPLQPQAVTTVGVNTDPPTISVVSNVTLNAGQTLSLYVTASDPNPQNTLTFTLGPGAPAGAIVNPASGQITWATSPAFGGTTNFISVIATDNGQPPLSATGTVEVVLLQVTNPPVLAPIANYRINEGDLLTFTSSAADNNLPPRPLIFSLGLGAPANASIDPGTGLFQWRPTAAQAPSTNVISVIVSDNSTPALTATQQFTAIVRAVGNEFVLSFGSTNLQVGQSGFVPIVLTSSLELTNITATLQATGVYLTNLALASVSSETTGTLLQSLGSNLYAVGLTLNPANSPGGTRTVAQLGFLAVPQVHSAIVPLSVSNPSALQTGGGLAAKPGVASGRVIVIGLEPVLDISMDTHSSRMLTLYGNPGSSYQIAFETNLLGTNWVPAWRFPMTNLFQTFAVSQPFPQVFYRAWEFSADPPLLELDSSAPTNFELLLYGQKNSNYDILTAPNLTNASAWTPIAGFTMTNSFQFINVGGTTNPVMFFRAEKP